MRKEEILSQLENLVRENGYTYSLAVMVLQDLSIDVHKILEIDWHSRISFREFALMIGFMVKQPLVMEMPSQGDIQRHIDTTYRLLHQLHGSHLEPMRNQIERIGVDREPKGETETADRFDSIVGKGEWMTEPMFYGGSAPYGFQFLELASKRYEFDKQWLEENKQISMEEMVCLAHEIKALQERKARESSLPQNPSYDNVSRRAKSILTFRRE